VLKLWGWSFDAERQRHRKKKGSKITANCFSPGMQTSSKHAIDHLETKYENARRRYWKNFKISIDVSFADTWCDAGHKAENIEFTGMRSVLEGVCWVWLVGLFMCQV